MSVPHDLCLLKCPELGYSFKSISGYACYGGRSPVALQMYCDLQGQAPKRTPPCKRRHPKAKPTNG